MSRSFFLFFFFPCVLVGCAKSTEFVDPEGDAGLVFDMGQDLSSPADGGPFVDDRDSPEREDAASPTRPLMDALTCGMDEAQALQSIIRYTSCSGSEFYWFPHALFHAWEVGMLGLYAESGFSRFPRYSCDQWQCFARADSCTEQIACADIAVRDVCVEGETRCVAGVLEACARGGFWPSIDCGSLGAEFSCQSEGENSFCGNGECRLYGRVSDISCEDDALVICDGTVRVPCEGFRRGTVCTHAPLMGEVPVVYCGSGGMTPIYNEPNGTACEGGVVSFLSLDGRSIQTDCAVAGFSGCPNIVSSCQP